MNEDITALNANEGFMFDGSMDSGERCSELAAWGTYFQLPAALRTSELRSPSPKPACLAQEPKEIRPLEYFSKKFPQRKKMI